MEQKTCTHCKEVKDSDQFYKSTGGVYAECKPCRNARSKRYWESNPGKHSEYTRRSAAKARENPTLPKTCKVCGVEKQQKDFYATLLTCYQCDYTRNKEKMNERQKSRYHSVASEPEKLKTCTKCGVEKQQKDFYGAQTHCAACKNLYTNERRAKQKAEQKAEELKRVIDFTTLYNSPPNEPVFVSNCRVRRHDGEPLEGMIFVGFTLEQFAAFIEDVWEEKAK